MKAEVYVMIYFTTIQTIFIVKFVNSFYTIRILHYWKCQNNSYQEQFGMSLMGYSSGNQMDSVADNAGGFLLYKKKIKQHLL